MFDVVTMGEILIDFKLNGHSEGGFPLYEANPGGGPANVAVGVSRLGGKAAFLGKVGGDALSVLLRDTLLKYGVDDGGLITDGRYEAALAFVHLDEKGDRSFSFYRKGSADLNIISDEIDLSRIQSSKAFHFSSVSMTEEPSRSATFFAAERARRQGLLVSYDPNFRPSLWDNETEAVAVIKKGLLLCDMLKLSQEELELLTGESKIDAGLTALAEQYAIPLIFATLGPRGCRYLFQGEFGRSDAYDVKTIDTTGAGDSFVAAALYRIICTGGGLSNFESAKMAEIADFACAASSLSTAAAGGIPSMPDLDSVISLMEGR